MLNHMESVKEFYLFPQVNVYREIGSLSECRKNIGGFGLRIGIDIDRAISYIAICVDSYLKDFSGGEKIVNIFIAGGTDDDVEAVSFQVCTNLYKCISITIHSSP
ncbi:hypothetical protein AVEN_85537-1 [Araneus ventricosus]|uniref:Uncharacterized protein n=1 Tax=Araneus ventricosus TaxID=182803 RepID=A0A4Y2ACB7_ARAVE|nr:hypothetical protein AVEN_85537-1 [Araneus ventricosus]